MRNLGRPTKAVAAARNAVSLVSRDKPLDLAVYQHSLASMLIEANQFDEAERLLVTVTESLRSSTFDALKREVARGEAFEVYSSARGDVAAYVSLLNRAQLRLASLYERRGALDDARAQYERVLTGRSDDATALAGLARLARSDAERKRHYAEAFEANPFSMNLVREYQRYLLRVIPSVSEGPGGQGREHRAARPPGPSLTLGVTSLAAPVELEQRQGPMRRAGHRSGHLAYRPRAELDVEADRVRVGDDHHDSGCLAPRVLDERAADAAAVHVRIDPDMLEHCLAVGLLQLADADHVFIDAGYERRMAVDHLGGDGEIGLPRGEPLGGVLPVRLGGTRQFRGALGIGGSGAADPDVHARDYARMHIPLVAVFPYLPVAISALSALTRP